MNHSPRLAQLRDRDPHIQLPLQLETDVCIVGAGIAGVMTAYFTLLYGEQQVILVDAERIAHGATGHNAGQIAPYFEKSFDEIVEQYGRGKAHDAQQAIRDARDRLQEIVNHADLQTPVHSFVGYAWCSTDHQIEDHLHKKHTREITHNDFDAIFVREDHPRYQEWQDRYPGLFDALTAEQIRHHLQTDSDEFIAVLACKKWVTNSALLCEELVQWMQQRHPDRFAVYEHSPVSQIDLWDDHVMLTIIDNEHQSWSKIQAERIVLCTNGFDHFTITNHVGDDINHRFHESVQWLVGYMSAYLDEPGQTPTAISYFMEDNVLESATEDDVYFYLTRRPYHIAWVDHTLLSLGGPEMSIGERIAYDRQAQQPDRAHDQNERFLRQYYAPYPQDNEFHFRWHGLMGFTKTGLRMIGPDPRHDRLFYNLGCNGVGILTSIHGGRKLGKIFAWQTFTESVFDVRVG